MFCSGCDNVKNIYRPYEEIITKEKVKKNGPSHQHRTIVTKVPELSTAICLNKAAGRPSNCPCDTVQARKLYDQYVFANSHCPVGEYWSGCSLNASSLGKCTPCSYVDLSSAFYTGYGLYEMNNCPFQCRKGYFYSHPVGGETTTGCIPCTSCSVGYIQTRQCEQTVDANSYTNKDTICTACPPGTTSTGQNATICEPCPIGFVSRDYGSTCIECDNLHKTVKNGSIVCIKCPLGHVRDVLDPTQCSPCPAGTFLSSTLKQCLPCPPGTAQPNSGKLSCKVCVNAVAKQFKNIECDICEGGTFPSPISNDVDIPAPAVTELPETVTPDMYIDAVVDAFTYLGSNDCISCPQQGVPTDAAAFDWVSQCQWQCRTGYFRNRASATCESCEVPCTGFGVYRPQCSAGLTQLPLCVACTNGPGSHDSQIQGVHFVYTSSSMFQSTCTFQCLPGYTLDSANNICIECPALPSTVTNFRYIDDSCQWACARTYKLNVNGECEQCELLPHPRTLIDAKTFGVYFGNQGLYANFDECNDNIQKEWGLTYPITDTTITCGNGIFDESAQEECDDGNRNDGDGCSANCKHEHAFYDCNAIGSLCVPNCSFPWVGTSKTIGLRGFYLTDDTCSNGPRSIQLREICGASCPSGVPRLPLDACTPENKGCLQCESNYYVDNINVRCVECGTRCTTGYFGKPECAITQPTSNENVDVTEARKGCFPCTYNGVTSSESVDFITRGDVPNDPTSCRYVCTENHYCDSQIDPVDGACDGQCIPCTSAADLNPPCTFEEQVAQCTSANDTTCVPCTTKPENSKWIESDIKECAFDCNENYVWQPELQKCDECAIDKNCPIGYAAQSCENVEDDTTADGNSVLRYCKKCPPPVQYGMEAVGGNAGICIADCILNQFFSPDTRSTECQMCAPAASCITGTKYIPCTRRLDTQCQICPPLSASKHLEYYTPDGSVPSCQTRCKIGYAQHETNGNCYLCDLTCDTQPGFYPEHLCQAPDQRFKYPECVACDDAISQRPLHSSYFSQCEWKCDDGYYFAIVNDKPACNPCTPCKEGQYPAGAYTCTTFRPSIQCVTCDSIPEHAIATSNIDSTCPFACDVGYYKHYTNNGKVLTCSPRYSLKMSELLNQQPGVSVTPTPDTNAIVNNSNADLPLIVITGQPRRYTPKVSSSAYKIHPTFWTTVQFITTTSIILISY